MVDDYLHAAYFESPRRRSLHGLKHDFPRHSLNLLAKTIKRDDNIDILDENIILLTLGAAFDVSFHVST